MSKAIVKTATQVCTLLLAARCTHMPATTTSPLHRYESSYHSNQMGASLSGLRYQSLQDAAMSVGARAGLAWRSSQILGTLQCYERQLDLIFNFHGLMLDNYVLPPVLIEGRLPLEQTSEAFLRIADRSYAIQSQARFVTMPPTWRDYLFTYYSDPGVPDQSLLPKSRIEREVWDHFLQEGWQAGLTQADVIFTENLGRLKRDYQGMILYRTLLAQNMVTPPYVAEADFGITGGETEMSIHDRVLKITAQPRFNTDGKEWQTQIIPEKR